MYQDFYNSKKNTRFSKIRTVGLVAAVIFFFFIRGPFWLERGISIVWNMFPVQRAAQDDDVVVALRARLQDLQAQDQKLENLLASTAHTQKNLVPAQIRLGSGYLFIDTLMLDKGTESGIAIGNPVIAEDATALGSIVEAGSGWSKAALHSRLGNKVILRSGQGKNTVFEAVGIGGGELEAELPVSVPFAVGDTVWWGEHPEYVVGIVDRLDHAPERQIQSVVIRSPRSIRSILNAVVVLE